MSDNPRPRWRTRQDFLQPGTDDVLRNRLGITDGNELARVERIVSLQRSVELALRPILGDFDLTHLRAVHRFLFGDLYEWAGVIRPFDIAKGETMFCLAAHVDSYATDVFGRLANRDLLRGLSRIDFIDAATDLLADLNALHPFREGNGRTQRAFLTLLAEQAGHGFRWPADAEQQNNDASIASMRGDHSALRALVDEAVCGATPHGHSMHEATHTGSDDS